MKIEILFSLTDLSPEDAARYELQCQKIGKTPDAKLADMIRDFNAAEIVAPRKIQASRKPQRVTA